MATVHTEENVCWADDDPGMFETVDDMEHTDQEDACDHLLRYFPIPGEIWVHLRTECNYLSSLLTMYSAPQEGEAPCIINGWRMMQKVSPYRVTYGFHNPAMRGIILTSDSVVPNFSWTPQLAMELEGIESILSHPIPPDFLILPAVTNGGYLEVGERGGGGQTSKYSPGMCRVIRVFYHASQWYIASNHSIEEVCTTRIGSGPLGQKLAACLMQYSKRRLWKFLDDLPTDRVWFFGLYDNPTSLVHLGTCALISKRIMFHAQYGDMPNLDFTVHQYLPPCVPILPEIVPGQSMTGIIDHIYHLDGLSYCSDYDGLFLVNPITMFAVRLSTPDVVFLTPLLKKKQKIADFLTLRVLETTNMEISKIHMDRMSRRWWETQVGEMMNAFFGDTHGALIHRIYWQVNSMSQWITGWMSYINSLCWDEWNDLDVDLQRLYVLLDYAYEEPNPANWMRILKNPKYTEWVAKAVVFTINQDPMFPRHH